MLPIATGEIKKYNYYRCTNGKRKCDEHKKYLSEKKVSIIFSNLFKIFDFNYEDVEWAYKAKKEKFKNQDDLFIKKKNIIIAQIEKTKLKQDKLLDSYLSELVSQNVYEAKVNEIKKDEVMFSAQLKNLKKSGNGYATLELAKEALKTAYIAGNNFLSLEETEKQKVVQNILWNCEVKNHKITNFSLNKAYSLMQKTPKKGEFHLWSE